MNTASLSFVAVIGLVQGFIQWPLIVSCIRWLFRWFEEAGKSKKLPGWFYGFAFVFGLLFAEVIEMAIAMIVIPVSGPDTESWREAGKYWLSGHLIGIIVQVVLIGIASRLRPKP